MLINCIRQYKVSQRFEWGVMIYIEDITSTVKQSLYNKKLQSLSKNKYKQPVLKKNSVRLNGKFLKRKVEFLKYFLILPHRRRRKSARHLWQLRLHATFYEMVLLEKVTNPFRDSVIIYIEYLFVKLSLQILFCAKNTLLLLHDGSFTGLKVTIAHPP